MLDYLIIGQGIAGSLLSYELLKNNHNNILVIDKENPKASSMVGTGICNPIVGKYLKKTWMVDDFFSQLVETYQDLEKILATNFLRKIPIYHKYNDIEEQNRIMGFSANAEWQDYINTSPDNTQYQLFVESKLGGWESKNSFQVNGSRFLLAWRKYLIEKQKYKSLNFNENKLVFHQQYIEYKHIKAKKVIFCRGFEDATSNFFKSLPFSLVKGEWLKIKIKDVPQLESIIIQSCFLLPLENQEYIVGSTYHWDNLTEDISINAKEELVEKLERFLKVPYQIIEQKVGIRPATHTRKPFLGKHFTHQNLFIFNGLGTKGFSLAPFFAKQMAKYLISDDINAIQNEARVKYKTKI
ncbi:MAG: FAD-binding oxidoreductase [Bacteroidetes bacterium]|nr:MAG: FAD-binding oxidoreductase [Bacteroidota bacterium]TAG89277.1 MAG: FAD-binding oxidoreductase [Bacteroidota bacterium]